MAGHIIHRQKVELRISNEQDAFELQNRVSRLLRDELPALIEPLLNKISPNGTVLRIEKLHLDLGSISRINLEKDFKEKLIGQLSKALSGVSMDKQNDPVTKLRKEQSLLDSLLFFLHQGRLPWYSTARDFKEWEADFIKSFSNKEWTLLIEGLKNDVRYTENFIQRLTMQFSEPFLTSVLSHILTGPDPGQVYHELSMIWNEVNKENSWTENTRKIRLWKALLYIALTTDAELLKNAGNEKGMKALKERMLLFEKQEPGSAEKDHLVKSETKLNPIKSLKTSGDDDLMVENCGMVILHPFLQMYFEELGMLEDNDFRSDESRQRAVLLLHYLVTGETEVAEIHLLLPKLLCSIDFDEPVPAVLELTEQERTESETLLRSVLSHWEPLSRSSVDSLRQTFLQREGKLEQTDTGWKLYVEQKAVDVLLNKLPWGVSTIRLPWLNNLLNVEWF
jgi:hypothetical protein